MGELPSRLPLPERGQGKFEEGQIAGFAADIVQNALHQAILKADALFVGGLFDGALQLLPRHGAEDDEAALQGIGQGAVLEGGAEKINAEGEQDVAFVGHRSGSQQVGEELLPLGGVMDKGE